MTNQIVPAAHTIPPELAGINAILPDIIRRADERVYWRFIGFFAESIRNRNTRLAYFRVRHLQILEELPQHRKHQMPYAVLIR